MEIGRVVYSPDYETQKKKLNFLRESAEERRKVERCSCCGTKGPGLKFVKSYGDKLCSECRIEWKDYKGFS